MSMCPCVLRIWGSVRHYLWGHYEEGKSVDLPSQTDSKISQKREEEMANCWDLTVWNVSCYKNVEYHQVDVVVHTESSCC